VCFFFFFLGGVCFNFENVYLFIIVLGFKVFGLAFLELFRPHL
jgi:hypothetical protein